METDQEKSGTDKKEEVRKKQTALGLLMLQMGFEFAFILAVPLFIFIYLGRRLDAHTHEHDIYAIAGLLIALLISAAAIYKRVMDVDRMMRNKSSNQ